MERYIALLRGINVSGKNRIPMPELKEHFGELGFSGTVTYLNSGNVAFSAEEGDEQELAGTVKDMIEKEFGLDIPVFVIKQSDLKDILAAAPQWWGTEDKGIYDNLIFVMPPVDAAWVCGKIGEPTEELERIQVHSEKAIFWSFDRQKYAKANWWKSTAGKGIGEYLTIRTANTLRKAAEL